MATTTGGRHVVGLPKIISSEVTQLKHHEHWLTNEIQSLRARHHASAGYRSEAENLEDFPDSSFANRQAPYIPNELHEIGASYFDSLRELHVEGEIFAFPAQKSVHVFNSAEQKTSAYLGWNHGGFTALAISESTRFLWCGTTFGQLHDVDLTTMRRTEIRKDVHKHPIAGIFRNGSDMISIDHSGVVAVWRPDPATHEMVSLNTPHDTFSLPPGFKWLQKIDSRIWLFYPDPIKAVGLDKGRGILRVYDYRITAGSSRGVPTEITLDVPGLGEITSGAVVPSQANHVYLGHRCGHVTVWNREKVILEAVQKVSTERITTTVGPSRFLWVGFDTGFINVLDVGASPWRVIKRWQAHEGRIDRLLLDPASLWDASSLRVISAGRDATICFWDGFLRRDWMSGAMQRREAAFCVTRDLRVNIFSYNVDGQDPRRLVDPRGSPNNRNLLVDFLRSLVEPDIIHFGFQEMIDLSSKTLALATILFATDHRDVTGVYKEWRELMVETVSEVLGSDYVLVQHSHLVGIASDLFARKPIANRMKDLEVASVKTGFDSSYGNKGSILIRFVLEDSSFCFINSHLTSGQKMPTARTRDLIEILETAHFKLSPSASTRLAYVSRGDGTRVSDHETTFCCGDLNFRIDLTREEVIDAVARGNSAHLQPFDQLVMEMQTNPSFQLRSFREPQITFDPTYKYDHGSTRYDSSEKQRVPSWCDRILYRSEPSYKVVPVGYRRYEADISDHRPISGSFITEVKTVVPDLHDVARREVVREWATVKEALLETARSYYPVY